jgi:subtilisin family serine protease
LARGWTRTLESDRLIRGRAQDRTSPAYHESADRSLIESFPSGFGGGLGALLCGVVLSRRRSRTDPAWGCHASGVLKLWTTTRFYPAAYPEVVSVAATTPNDNLYDWSNRGRDWVQVAAPGCDIAPVRGSGYGSFCGTSAATPIASGIAALALSLDPGLTASGIHEALGAAAVRCVSSPVRTRRRTEDAGRTRTRRAPEREAAAYRRHREFRSDTRSSQRSLAGRNRFHLSVAAQ